MTKKFHRLRAGLFGCVFEQIVQGYWTKVPPPKVEFVMLTEAEYREHLEMRDRIEKLDTRNDRRKAKQVRTAIFASSEDPPAGEAAPDDPKPLTDSEVRRAFLAQKVGITLE